MTVWSIGVGQGGKQYRKQDVCKQQTLEIPYVNKAETSINNWESTNPQQLQLSRQQSLPPALLDQLSPANLIETTCKNIFYNNSQTGNSGACGTCHPPCVIMLKLSRMPRTGGKKERFMLHFRCEAPTIQWVYSHIASWLPTPPRIRQERDRVVSISPTS